MCMTASGGYHVAETTEHQQTTGIVGQWWDKQVSVVPRWSSGIE